MDSVMSFSRSHERPLTRLNPVRFPRRANLDKVMYRTFFGKDHPRLMRMHSAYGRRRGRGRW